MMGLQELLFPAYAWDVNYPEFNAMVCMAIRDLEPRIDARLRATDMDVVERYDQYALIRNYVSIPVRSE